MAVPAAACVTPSPGAATTPDAADGTLKESPVAYQLSKTKMCLFFERGRCAAVNCNYAHSPSELKTRPNLQKTKLCRVWLQGEPCPDVENCPFAHGDGEIRVTEGIYKTQLCKFHERGSCKKGFRCNHAHGLAELRAASQVAHFSTPLKTAITANAQRRTARALHTDFAAERVTAAAWAATPTKPAKQEPTVAGLFQTPWPQTPWHQDVCLAPASLTAAPPLPQMQHFVDNPVAWTEPAMRLQAVEAAGSPLAWGVPMWPTMDPLEILRESARGLAARGGLASPMGGAAATPCHLFPETPLKVGARFFCSDLLSTPLPQAVAASEGLPSLCPSSWRSSAGTGDPGAGHLAETPQGGSRSRAVGSSLSQAAVRDAELGMDFSARLARDSAQLARELVSLRTEVQELSQHPNELSQRPAPSGMWPLPAPEPPAAPEQPTVRRHRI